MPIYPVLLLLSVEKTIHCYLYEFQACEGEVVVVTNHLHGSLGVVGPDMLGKLLLCELVLLDFRLSFPADSEGLVGAQ